MISSSVARAQISAVLIEYGTNFSGLVLGPTNNNAVADVQFYLPREYAGVQVQVLMESGASGSVADFYLMQRAGPGATSANAIASNTGVAITSVGSYGGLTPFSGLDLKAGTYHLVMGASAGAPILACPNPVTYIYQDPGVSYQNLAAQPGVSYEPASLFSSSSLAFEVSIYGYPAASAPSLGTNSLLVGSAAGSSSVVLSDSGSWAAASNSPFLHVASGSLIGTGNAVVILNYDAFTGTGTRTGTLTIAGQTLTVTQAGTDYLLANPVTTLVPCCEVGGSYGLALDGSDNLYIAGYGRNAIFEWNAADQQVTTLVSSGLLGPTGVAVDRSGNVYIADDGHGEFKEWIAATQQVATLASENYSWGATADLSGNVYSTIVPPLAAALQEWNPSTRQFTTLVSSGLNYPTGTAVDVAGNVYIADSNDNAIKVWNAATQQLSTLVSSGIFDPKGIAVDGSGDVYIADWGDNAVKEWNASTQQLVTLPSPELGGPSGVAVDGSGNVYIGNYFGGGLMEIPYSFVGPASLTETGAAGSDSFNVLPSTTSLTGIFAPTSDQSWLTIASAANGVVGFSFTANTTGSSRAAHITVLGQQITVAQSASALLAQTIAFGPLANQALGAPPFALTATASSGLPVSLASNTASVCALSGDALTLLAAGTCTITASQAGNSNYAAAVPSTQSFVVYQSQTIEFDGPGFKVDLGSAPITLGATASSGLPVTLVSTTSLVCSVHGYVVTLVSAGTCSITASQTGNSTYAAASPVTQSFTVYAANGAQPSPVLGASALFVGSAAGACSVVLSYSGPWTASSNSAFLHVSAGSAGGANSSVVVFTYDAFTGTGTRTGTLTVAGLTVTVTQAGTDYLGPGPTLTLVSSGLSSPYDLAIDGSGNVYIADMNDSAVKKWSAPTQQLTPIVSSGLLYPSGVAVDGSGNVFIGDTNHGAIKEWSAATEQVATIVPDLSGYLGLAADRSGNLYIAAAGDRAIEEWIPSTQQVTTLVSSGLSDGEGVAVDVAGNVYIVDCLNNDIKEWNASTEQVTALVSSGLDSPSGLAVDGSGNVYIADTNNGAIKVWSAATQQVTTLASTTPNIPWGLARDGAGNVYFTDAGGSVVEEMPYAFVGPGSFTEAAAAGSDSLLPVIPSAQSLTGVYAPTSDAAWLSIGTIANSVVSFSFTANTTGVARVAHIAILGRQIAVTQNPPAPQTITFNAPPTQILGIAPFTLSATATSGLSVTLTSNSASVCTVSGATGATLTILTAGTCSLTASQSGDMNYLAAPSVTESFTVAVATSPLGSFTTAAALAGPGLAFHIPVTLALNSGFNVGALTFGIRIAPNAAAPPLTGSLTFTQSAAIADPPFVTVDTTTNAISVLWASLTTPLSGTVVLGTVSGAAPAGAVPGQSYSVAIPGQSAQSAAGILIPLSVGTNGAVTIVQAYLVGDVAPYTSDTAPNFGDAVLDIRDLIQELFAVNSIPGFRPVNCSDRYDAMDGYPEDTATARGGDGILDIRDLIEELFRVTNLDTSRPRRATMGGALPWATCAGGSTGDAITVTAAARRTSASSRPVRPAQAALALGHSEPVAAGQQRAPIYLQARQTLAGVALTFGLGDGQSPLHFIANPAAPPSLLEDTQPGVVAAAWLNGLTLPSGRTLLLGYVAGPPAALANLSFYGASAGSLGNPDAIQLDLASASEAR
jgi:sugar lactone lactonase YvrE